MGLAEAVTSRRRGLVVTATAAVALAVVGSACGGSGFQYITSPTDRAYVKVPEKWAVFDREQVLGASGSGSDDTGSGLRFLSIFDADPQPSLDHDLRTAEHPFGLVRVRELDSEERDAFSRKDLRNEIVPLDDILEQKTGEVNLVVEPQTITKAKGTAGVRLVYEVATDEGSFTVDQTGLVDPDHRVVYFFIVGCESRCYQENRSTITKVADSWTIKEP